MSLYTTWYGVLIIWVIATRIAIKVVTVIVSVKMSKLSMYGRPWVVFDASNQDHRRWFADFNYYRTWGKCPVRFLVNEDHGDLLTQIQRELIRYYVSAEFGANAVSKRARR